MRVDICCWTEYDVLFATLAPVAPPTGRPNDRPQPLRKTKVVHCQLLVGFVYLWASCILRYEIGLGNFMSSWFLSHRAVLHSMKPGYYWRDCSSKSAVVTWMRTIWVCIRRDWWLSDLSKADELDAINSELHRHRTGLAWCTWKSMNE